MQSLGLGWVRLDTFLPLLMLLRWVDGGEEFRDSSDDFAAIIEENIIFAGLDIGIIARCRADYTETDKWVFDRVETRVALFQLLLEQADDLFHGSTRICHWSRVNGKELPYVADLR